MHFLYSCFETAWVVKSALQINVNWIEYGLGNLTCLKRDFDYLQWSTNIVNQSEEDIEMSPSPSWHWICPRWEQACTRAGKRGQVYCWRSYDRAREPVKDVAHLTTAPAPSVSLAKSLISRLQLWPPASPRCLLSTPWVTRQRAEWVWKDMHESWCTVLRRPPSEARR